MATKDNRGAKSVLRYFRHTTHHELVPAASSARQILSSMGSMAVQSRCYLDVCGVNTVNYPADLYRPASLRALIGWKSALHTAVAALAATQP